MEGMEGILENARFMEESHYKSDGMLTAMMGLHASFTISDATLKKAVECVGDVSSRLDTPFGFHVHIAEDALDVKRCHEEHGIGVVDRLLSWYEWRWKRFISFSIFKLVCFPLSQWSAQQSKFGSTLYTPPTAGICCSCQCRSTSCFFLDLFKLVKKFI